MPVLAWRNDADGFAFSNSWILNSTEQGTLSALAQPLVSVAVATAAAIDPDPIFLAALGITLSAMTTFVPAARYGLCGGMAYSALDHWNARVPIPGGANVDDQPDRTAAASTSIRDSIWHRLLDSLGPGGALKTTVDWSVLLNQIPPALGGGAAGLKNRTLPEWDLLRAHIDNGTPWPIGLMYTNRPLWGQHQIVVHGYENTGPMQGILHVCDCNAPAQFGATASSQVVLDFSGPTLAATSPSDFSDVLAGFSASTTPVSRQSACRRVSGGS